MREHILLMFPIEWCKVGVGICYDMRFPELAALYAKKGCKLLCYPGAFNMTTGPVHWELLTRARCGQLYPVQIVITTPPFLPPFSGHWTTRSTWLLLLQRGMKVPRISLGLIQHLLIHGTTERPAQYNIPLTLYQPMMANAVMTFVNSP